MAKVILPLSPRGAEVRSTLFRPSSKLVMAQVETPDESELEHGIIVLAPVADMVGV